jgi:hypothetical protein
MGYKHIDNLYANQKVLMFKELWATEKIHGTSANVRWDGKDVKYFSGGCSHDEFVKLFNHDELKAKFTEIFGTDTTVIVFGEAYGGKCQGMSATYGKKLFFTAFEINCGDKWLAVDKADMFCGMLGIEFVPYVRIPATLAAIDAERDAPSIIAVRRGQTDKEYIREGVVLRPIVEMTMNNDERIMAKHKRDEFKETKTPRNVDPEQLKVLEEAEAIADEWVTEMRLTHVLDKTPARGELGFTIEDCGKVALAMVEDILREGKDEIVDSKLARKAIGKKTIELFKKRIKYGIMPESASC